MVEGDYYVRVAVDGKDVPLQNHCGGNPNSGDCRFTVSIYFSIGCICINLKYKLYKRLSLMHFIMSRVICLSFD